jgi:hypothetical protein
MWKITIHFNYCVDYYKTLEDLIKTFGMTVDNIVEEGEFPYVWDFGLKVEVSTEEEDFFRHFATLRARGFKWDWLTIHAPAKYLHKQSDYK